jgi:hypothetical protein
MTSSLYVLYMLLDSAHSLSGLCVKYTSFRQLDPFHHKVSHKARQHAIRENRTTRGKYKNDKRWDDLKKKALKIKNFMKRNLLVTFLRIKL